MLSGLLAAWVGTLAEPLHGRNAWRLQRLVVGVILAQGRRTVTRWFRAAGLAPSGCAPPGKLVVAGLVPRKPPMVESKDDLKRRIDVASKYVPLDHLCLSPQCGFSSTVEGNDLTRDEQIAKLSLIVDVAAEVWG
mgnify:CR=1 FL=1